jgi:IS5 family transposase
LWEERDKALEEGEKRLNNSNVERYASDKDARWGSKGKNKIWFGFKRHHAVDMRYGLISAVDVTPANTPDFRGIKNIIPQQGMSFLDKGYDYQEVYTLLKNNGCHPAIIRKNNNKEKNKDLDRWISAVRMPFEGTFSKMRKRAKFRGTVKVLFQSLAEAINHNLKKALVFLPEHQHS